MDYQPFDTTGFVSRLRRLTQEMLADGDRAYEEAGLDFRTRLFPIVYGLHRHGELTVNDLTRLSGFSQPATSQTLKQLSDSGYVTLAAGKDGRERIAALTQEGREMVDMLQPFWTQVRTALEDVIAETHPNFLAALESLERALEREPLIDRIRKAGERIKGSDVTVIPFTVAHRDAFRDLNLEWLNTFFEVEPYDEEQLSQPERILESGGEIYMAELKGANGPEIVGTGALYFQGDGLYEISKMAVQPDIRGKGIGARLMEKLIQRFRERGGKRLWLQTNNKLGPALKLYRRYGFVEFMPVQKSKYARANVFMEWRPQEAEAD
jgi:ribosomal protein S18 acetylase RimI-like enzyme